jgi:hypothetical protein
MNERIEKMMLEATKHMPHGYYVPGVYFEQFAELIVAECAEQVEQAKNSPFVSLDDAKRMKHFVDVTKKKIKKHFGVEE